MSRPTRPDRIDDLAATWVGRCDAGLTARQEIEFAAWRDADPRHADALKKFEAIWSAAELPRRPDAASFVRQRLAAHAAHRRRRRAVFSAGLATCLLLGLGWSVSRRGPLPEATAVASTTFLQPQRLVLPDGSIAEYSAGTEMVVDFHGDNRRVSFARGQAHFEVVHNPARPFVVTAGGLAVRAVGTAFAVQVERDSTAVLVTAGRVAVDSASTSLLSAPAAPLAFVDAGQSIDVHPGLSGDLPTIQALSPATMLARLSWRQSRVEFSSTPLAEVIAVVNRHNRVQFSIDDPSLGLAPLSGIFRLDEPEELARLLESAFGLKLERPTPDRIVLRPRT